MQKKLIECFSCIHGRKVANKFLKTLNEMKVSSSSVFDMDEVRTNVFVIRGNVTKKDWIELDLESDFMRI